MPRFTDESHLLDDTGPAHGRVARCGAAAKRNKALTLAIAASTIAMATTAVVLLSNSKATATSGTRYACTPSRTCEATESGSFAAADCSGSCDTAPVAADTWSCTGAGTCAKDKSGGGDYTSPEDCSDHCIAPSQLFKCEFQKENGALTNETACVLAEVNGTFKEYGCDGVCSLPTPELYACDGGNCARTYTPGRHTFANDPSCEESCSGPVKTFSCSPTTHQCTETPNGNFTDGDCDGACTGGKPVAEKYKCGSGDTNHQCVRDDVEGTFADDTCDSTCNKPSKQFHCQGKQCVEKDNCVSTAKNGCFADPDCDGTCE